MKYLGSRGKSVRLFVKIYTYILLYLYIISKFQISIMLMFIRIFKLIRSVNKY